MAATITNKEMAKEMSKDEIFEMWHRSETENQKLRSKIFTLEKTEHYLREEVDKFERLWNSTKVNEDIK